jgi:hypothetical protein
MSITPEQVAAVAARYRNATRYVNVAAKLNAVTGALESLRDRSEHGEEISGLASDVLYYLNQLRDSLDRKALQLRAGHTRTPNNTLRDVHVVYHCICGYETESDAGLNTHISFMISALGEGR